MHLKLPHYTKSDMAIMLSVLVPWVFITNRLIFGSFYTSSIPLFLAATIITFLIIGLSWQLHTWIAVILRERLPYENQMSIRFSTAIFIFMLDTCLVITLLFWLYEVLHFKAAAFVNENYKVALLTGCGVIVFVTFLHETVARFEKWKAVLIENEQLKKEYMQSQLLGLKSQINPHFLFNSLNSLSCLINEDEKEAELFLDEMSKVYRYMLRNNDEELVSLHTELDFIHSFYYLLKTRYGRSIELSVSVDDEESKKCLPPLTLQMLLDDVFNSNAGTKEQPITIQITAGNGTLEVRNSIHKKIAEEAGISGNLENIMNKFWLLCQKRVAVVETENERVIRIPLITEKRGKAA